MDSANKYDVIIMSNYDIVSINLCQEVGNGELPDSDCDIFVAVLCDRFLTTSPRTAGRRKQKPAQSEWIRRTNHSSVCFMPSEYFLLRSVIFLSHVLAIFS